MVKNIRIHNCGLMWHVVYFMLEQKLLCVSREKLKFRFPDVFTEGVKHFQMLI